MSGGTDAISWVLGVVETFSLSWADVMRMPFRTFLALNRHAITRQTNAEIAARFNRQQEV